MTPLRPFLFCFFLLISTAAAADSVTVSAPPPVEVEPPASPKQPPVPSSKSTLDPKQLRALQSLDIPTFKDPCTSYPATIACDASTPFRHVTSLTLANCSDDVALSNTALKSLSTLTSFAFRNCPITAIRFPDQLASNLENFTCVSSLNKLTGVFLSRLERLTHLTVADASVTASGPSIIIGNMRSLNTLTLSRTNLSGVMPQDWHPNLTYIDLSGNKIGGRIPISLTSLENLAHLNLSSNSLNETIPDTIGDLYSLKILSLSSNELSGSIPESLAAIPGLAHLDLGSNQLNGSIPGFLRDVKGLKYLNLEKNNFHGVLPFNASFIEGLEVFKVGENSNLCYNHTVLGTKMKLGIARCDKHGLPISPPPAKDDSDSSDDSSDDDYGNAEEKRRSHGGPSKIVLGVAIALSSIVFLIIFLVCLSRCCR